MIEDHFADNCWLMNGDCLERMKQIPDGSIDMVLTDPPYGTTSCKWDSVIPLDEMWAELKRVIKSGGAILLMAQTPFDKVLGCSNLEYLRYELIWEKSAATGFFNANKMPLKAHENILIFYKNLPTYNPQKTSGHVRKTAGRKEIGSEVYGKGVKKTNYDSTDRYPRSVLKFAKDNRLNSHHPTQKPVALMEYLIKTYTNPGETVLDFTMGSGTTGVAAGNLDRVFIGIERDEKYYGTAIARIWSEVTRAV